MFAHETVALAGVLLEPSAIEDAHLTVPLSNTAGILQLRSRMRYTLAVRAKHVTEEFLRERHDVDARAIVGHQEPSREPLPDAVVPIAHV